MTLAYARGGTRARRATIALVGRPLSGKTTLARWLSLVVPNVEVIDWNSIRARLQHGTDPLAESAKSQVLAGRQLDDNILSRLIADAAQSQDVQVVLDAYPRNEAQYQFMTTLIGPILVIHLVASRATIASRCTALGLPPLEDAHPGTYERWDVDLAAIGIAASNDHSYAQVDANAELSKVADAVLRTIHRPPGT